MKKEELEKILGRLTSIQEKTRVAAPEEKAKFILQTRLEMIPVIRDMRETAKKAEDLFVRVLAQYMVTVWDQVLAPIFDNCLVQAELPKEQTKVEDEDDVQSRVKVDPNEKIAAQVKKDLPGFKFISVGTDIDGNYVRVSGHGGAVRKARKVEGKWSL